MTLLTSTERLRAFIASESAGGIVLIVAAAVALAIANSALLPAYEAFLATPVVFSAGSLGAIDKPLLLWINDGLMALFFIVVGLEIKRELLMGELADRRAAALPVAGAVGGMALPALIYLALNPGGPGAAGWGVPMATDIAFALGLLAMLGSRVPYSLMIFVSALAIVDDLGAIMVIALFYAETIDFTALGVAAVTLAALIAISRIRIRLFWPYAILGVLLWLAVLASGVHATVAGVLLAFVIPLSTRADPRPLLAQAATARDEAETLGEKASNPVPTLERGLERRKSPAERMRYGLEPWTAFFVLPLFALANCGVEVNGEAIANAGSVFLGTALGLLVGKPLGIFAACWLAVRLGLARAPQAYRWATLMGAAALCGVGFTMAVFIATAAFEGTALLDQAKLGVLSGSIFSGLLGWALLARALGRDRETRGKNA
jgi:NhaA family Na+:H+ antiporter